MQAPPPMVSVVVPNYNYARYLRQRLDSIVCQTYTDFEVILLDDASTDDSLRVMEEYVADSRVRPPVVNEKNSGSPFVQWMKGIRLARGKYVWIAEADDLADPDFLETCVAQAELDADTAVCFAGSVLIDADGRRSRKDVNHWGWRKQGETQYYPSGFFARRFMYWRNRIINASGAIFRREYALELADSPFQRMRYCGDYLFWFELSLRGTVVRVCRNLNYFRQHPAKVTVGSVKAGEGIREDMEVVRLMEARMGISPYRKRLRRGLLYRKIRHTHAAPATRRALFRELREKLRGGQADYALLRFNRLARLLIPALPHAR